MSGDFQIGEWSVQPAVNRLRNGDRVVRLEPKVMQVLVCLAENAGEVVAREELIARVWADVFVTDDVLHRAIRELRRVFGDSTSAPTYIETIRKRGYRLMLPVAPDSTPLAGTSDVAVPAPVAVLETSPPAGHAGPLPLPVAPAPRWAFSIVAAGIALTVVGAVLAVASRSPEMTPQAHARFVPLVSGPLNESDPAVSPDGRRIAFVQREPGDTTSADIYVRDLVDGQVTRVTDHPASDRMPAWSPDGSRLAFIRATTASCDIVIRALPGAVDRTLVPCGNADDPKVAWAHDGSALLTSQAKSAHAANGWRLVQIDLITRVITPLTEPPQGIVGDHSPAISPDGRHIAFIRRASGGVSDIFITSRDGSGARRVTFDESDLTGLDWTGDGRAIIYSSDRAGGYSLWQVAASGGASTLLAGGAARMKHPVADRGARRVVYENWNYEINIWRVGRTRAAHVGQRVPAQSEAVTRSSDLWNLYPQISPDGTRVAFVSTQSGSHQLWLANSDGSNARQLTHGTGMVKSPRWSPDGTRLVYVARRQGAVDVQYIDVSTGAITTVTESAENEIAPAFSHDGTRILFGVANRDGSWQVLSVNVTDRSDHRVEIDDAVAAQPSADGSALYFTRPHQTGLWRTTSDRARSALVVEAISAGNTLGWFVASDAIYFVEEVNDSVNIRAATLGGGSAEVVARLPQFTWPGFSVAADGTVLYSRWDRRESNLMSLEY